MSEYYFSAQIDGETTLCISPMTSRRLELSGEEIDDESGHFLYIVRGGAEPREVEILARLATDDAIFRLREMLHLE
jgi:hypothetical protein